jgi:hypothetical protein
LISLQKIHDEAIGLLHKLTTSEGILASTIEADNYKRIWARDSIICGLTGILLEDKTIIQGLKNSLLTLASEQHELGMIPSNVLPGHNSDVSFGSLAGRIDANTWFIVGSCLYLLESNDAASWSVLKPAVAKCRKFLKSVEFNDKGWIYTPLSGNWADEYPVHGYTLYDNTLRLWGERLWLKISGEDSSEFDVILEKTRENFWPSDRTEKQNVYHEAAFKSALNENSGHYAAFVLPGCYDMRFDAAGNALAMLLFEVGESQKVAITGFIDQLHLKLGKHLIPAFWPVITEKSPDWNLLRGNYSFNFKNDPGYFHNGGVWPVWMGLFCLALSKLGMKEAAEGIIDEYIELISKDSDWAFNEYINTVDFGLDGKTQMGYTASGIVFMKAALDAPSFIKKLHL